MKITITTSMYSWLTTLLVGLCLPAYATEDIRPWPGSRVINEEAGPVSGYRLITSGLKRQAATTFGASERHLPGTLARKAWEISHRQDLDTLRNFLINQLEFDELLYQCDDLDCGSSHFWANEVFGTGRLVGRDTDQQYQVLLKYEGDIKHLYLIYLTHRGPRQTVYGIDHLTTQAAVHDGDINQEEVEKALASSEGWLPGLVAEGDTLNQEASVALINGLKSQAAGVKRRLFLMVHCYESKDMATNQVCSDRLAEQLRLATYDGIYQLDIRGHAALAVPPDRQLVPAVRFVFWPRR